MVAGLACTSESTSKIMRIVGIKLIRSPFGKHKTLLSSKTVFKFSTHNVSTGPK